MRGVSRRENLEGLAKLYLLYKQNDVYNRENEFSYSYEKGRLDGFCLACSYDIDETPEYLIIKSRTGATILKINKDEFRSDSMAQ